GRRTVMKIHDLQPAPGSNTRKRRVARGIAGKGGKTAGRGTKGQHARNTVPRGFEGGQLPIQQRVPKMKGFNNPFRVDYGVINLDTLEAFDGADVTYAGVRQVLSSLRNMFKVPDLRNKILFTLVVLALYRFGSHVPTPGVDFQAVKALEKQSQAGGVLGFLSFFSGGALTRFAIFGLGVMPYITSSIIMQVLTVVIPKLEQWQDQGAIGQKKITQWTRYLT